MLLLRFATHGECIKVKIARFDVPVCVLVGLGYPKHVASALEALEFLREYPGETREKTTALAACRAALEGRTNPQTARFALAAFAVKKDILLEEPVVKIVGSHKVVAPSVV